MLPLLPYRYGAFYGVESHTVTALVTAVAGTQRSKTRWSATHAHNSLLFRQKLKALAVAAPFKNGTMTEAIETKKRAGNILFSLSLITLAKFDL